MCSRGDHERGPFYPRDDPERQLILCGCFGFVVANDYAYGCGLLEQFRGPREKRLLTEVPHNVEWSAVYADRVPKNKHPFPRVFKFRHQANGCSHQLWRGQTGMEVNAKGRVGGAAPPSGAQQEGTHYSRHGD